MKKIFQTIKSIGIIFLALGWILTVVQLYNIKVRVIKMETVIKDELRKNVETQYPDAEFVYVLRQRDNTSE